MADSVLPVRLSLYATELEQKYVIFCEAAVYMSRKNDICD